MKTVKELSESLGMSVRKFSIFLGIPYRTMQNYNYELTAIPEYFIAILNEITETYTNNKRCGYVWVVSSGEKFAEGEEQKVFYTSYAAEKFGRDRGYPYRFCIGKRKAIMTGGENRKLVADMASRITDVCQIYIAENAESEER